jgi:hypothetical protein
MLDNLVKPINSPDPIKTNVLIVADATKLSVTRSVSNFAVGSAPRESFCDTAVTTRIKILKGAESLLDRTYEGQAAEIGYCTDRMTLSRAMRQALEGMLTTAIREIVPALARQAQVTAANAHPQGPTR